MWQLKTFDELSNDELFAIMQLRNQVFVVEQQRLYQELDQNDKRALHLFQVDADGDIVAYARIFTEVDGRTVTFGRVVTSKKVRGQGVGKELLNQIMITIGQRFPERPIEIEAQAYVRDFYAQAGFQAQGKEFIYSLTPHIKMTHAPLPAQ